MTRLSKSPMEINPNRSPMDIHYYRRRDIHLPGEPPSETRYDEAHKVNEGSSIVAAAPLDPPSEQGLPDRSFSGSDTKGNNIPRIQDESPGTAEPIPSESSFTKEDKEDTPEMKGD